jgi:hypothetical protein
MPTECPITLFRIMVLYNDMICERVHSPGAQPGCVCVRAWADDRALSPSPAAGLLPCSFLPHDATGSETGSLVHQVKTRTRSQATKGQPTEGTEKIRKGGGGAGWGEAKSRVLGPERLFLIGQVEIRAEVAPTRVLRFLLYHYASWPLLTHSGLYAEPGHSVRIISRYGLIPCDPMVVLDRSGGESSRGGADAGAALSRAQGRPYT